MPDWENNPICPHCGEVDDQWWDGMPKNAGDGYGWVATCAECEGAYAVTMCMTATFRSAAPRAESSDA